MSKSEIAKKAVLGALATTIYIVIVATFFFYIPKMFDSGKPDTILAPISMLSLLVFSMALVESLIFARPILWYWGGQKREAISLLVYTLVTFLIITLIILSVLFLVLY